MAVRKTYRLSVRVSQEDKDFLKEWLKERGLTYTGWLREKIWEDWSALPEAVRKEAIEKMVKAGVSFEGSLLEEHGQAPVSEETIAT